MNRLLASLATALLLSTAQAQCFETDFGTLLGIGDDTLFASQPLGFNFPMDGAVPTATHVRVNTNGCAFLWNAATGEQDTTATGYSTVLADVVNNLRGTAGGAPRIAPLWYDLNMTAANNAGVYLNTSASGKATITWANAARWASGGTTGPVFTFQAQLFASGDVRFFYDAAVQTVAANALVGISVGDGIGIPPESDLSSPSGPGSIVYEAFDTGLFDLQSLAIHFFPFLLFGYAVQPHPYGNCVHAAHDIMGQGCYNLSNSVYEFHADAVAASAALTGRSVSYVPASGTYYVSGNTFSYLAPGTGNGPVNLTATATDDGEVEVDLSLLSGSPTLSTPQGPQSILRVHTNGILSWGATALTFPGSNSFTPTAAAMLNGNNGAIYAWHDFNEAETLPVASPRIQIETFGSPVTHVHVTWPNVESYSTPAATNPTTMQFQIDLANSIITTVWTNVDTDITTTLSTATLIGYTPPGSSVDPGSSVLTTAFNKVIRRENGPMTLSASPIPVINPSTLVNFTITGAPEFQPGSGVYLTTLFLSATPIPSGIELMGVLTNTLGCSAYIGSLDVNIGTALTDPNVVPYLFSSSSYLPNDTIGVQAVSLFDPAIPLSNGEDGGFVISNGILSTTLPF